MTTEAEQDGEVGDAVAAVAGRGRRSVRRGSGRSVPELTVGQPMERLDGPPPAAPRATESAHDKARRQLITQAGQWMVLNARVKLTEASARRLVRSYQRAKPARLDEHATGRFTARPFLRDGTWLVAACYQPPGSQGPEKTSR